MGKKYITYYGEYSLKHWIRMILNEEITLPPYQRNFVWLPHMAVKLIENLRDNIFVPPIIIASYSGETGKEKAQNYVIDGQQRLSSILLTFLGYWPIDFKKPELEMANEGNTNEKGDDDIVDIDDEKAKIIHAQEWGFKKIQNKYRELGNIDDLISYLSTESRYKKIDDIKNMDNVNQDLIERYKKLSVDEKFLSNCFLGFSYIKTISQNNNDEKRLFSNIFRSINISSVPLSDEESREAFYWLKPERKDFLKPVFFDEFRVGYKRLDFARILAFSSEAHQIYMKRVSNINRTYSPYTEFRVAVRFGTKLNPFEKYIEEYVSTVIDDKDSDKYGKYHGYYLDNIKNLSYDYERIRDREYKFSGLLDSDYFLFGLVFWTVFAGKKLKKDIQNLSNELNSAIERVRKHDDIKQVGKLGRIRARLTDSVQIYSKYME